MRGIAAAGSVAGPSAARFAQDDSFWVDKSNGNGKSKSNSKSKSKSNSNYRGSSLRSG